VFNLAVENDETYIANGVVVHNCRSSIILIGKNETAQQVRDDIDTRPSVVPKGEEQFDKQGLRTRTGKIRKPSRTDRSPLKGQATHKQTYASWLEVQPKYYQEAILGKAATKEFRSGKSLNSVLKSRNSAIDFSSLNEALKG
jgi:hypothetical protein